MVWSSFLVMQKRLREVAIQIGERQIGNERKVDKDLKKQQKIENGRKAVSLASSSKKGEIFDIKEIAATMASLPNNLTLVKILKENMTTDNTDDSSGKVDWDHFVDVDEHFQEQETSSTKKVGV